jgi:hypothetical protein
MSYVAKDDIIIQVESEQDFTQGISQSYEILVHKDFIGNPLNLNEPTSFHVALYVDGSKAVQYSDPRTFGVSDILNVDKAGNTGKLDFTIDDSQSIYIPQGDIYAEISIIFENYYPQPKTYIFPKIKLGKSINNPDIPFGNENTGTDTGSNTGNGGNGSTVIEAAPTSTGTFTIQEIDGSNPTAPGYLTVDSNYPMAVKHIIFRNLNANNTRLTSLENFLEKRILNDKIDGVITIIDKGPTNMYAIYKIDTWERIDITQGNGIDDDSDGIKVYVTMEAASAGPGVTKTEWEIGQEVTYTLDAHGGGGIYVSGEGTSSGSAGILVYVDKRQNPLPTSNDYAPTGVKISYSPYQDSNVTVEINGISVDLGDGVKDTDSYFSGDGGVNATRIEEIRAGDELYWNGSKAGFELIADDEINLIYEAKADDLR